MGNQTMKNYPIIKSNEAVTVLFTAPRHGYVLDYSDDHYKDILYKSDWSEGAFSKVDEDWFKGKCITVLGDKERAFVRMLIENQSGVLFKESSADNAKVFYVNVCCWCYTTDNKSTHLIGKKSLHIPFHEIFNDSPVSAPVSPSVKDRYRASVKLTTELLAENERLRNNGDYILSEQQVWVINELINTSQLLIDQKTPVTPPMVNIMVGNHIVYQSDNLSLKLELEDGLKFFTDCYKSTIKITSNKPVNKTPPIEWKEVHEVKIGDTWFQVNPVFVSEVEMFFYDPRPAPLVSPAPTNSVRKSNLSVINLNSPDYRNNEVGYLCIDDDGVLHPYDPESPITEVKLCKNIL